MIEAVLEANGFRDAYAFLDQPHVQNELLEIADRARRGEEHPTADDAPAATRG
jgi:hypothetical protein